jgi:hypothetical protein
MSLFSRIKEHISAFTQDSSPQRLANDEDDPAQIEGLRAEMLNLMDEAKIDVAASLRLRIRCATTLRSLWFMRSDLMGVLSLIYGEAEARHQVELISAKFRDALPSALRSRPSPLGRTD